MSLIEIISLIVTIVCLLSFCIVFTILMKHYFDTNVEKVKEGKDDIELLDNIILEEKEKNNKIKKGFKITLKVFSWIILSGLLVGFGISLYSRVSGNIMVFNDSTNIVIASGSMSEKNKANDYLVTNDLDNQFDTYDIIGLTKYKAQEDIKLYDIVAYKNDKDITIVHRIIDIITLTDGEVRYNTRGDSNNVSDNNSQYQGYLEYKNIIGYYNGSRIRGIGIFIIFLQSNSGIVTILAVIYSLFMFDYLNGKYNKAINKRTNNLIELLDYDLKNKNKEENKNYIVTDFKETLYYKGYAYVFSEGKLLAKNKICKSDIETTNNDDNIVKYNKDEENPHMLVIVDTKGGKTIKYKNVETNSSKIIEGVKEEEVKKALENIQTIDKEIKR